MARHKDGYPDLDAIYDEHVVKSRRRIALPAVRAGCEEARNIPAAGSRALWLAQLVQWLPEDEQAAPARDALEALAEIDPSGCLEVAMPVLNLLPGCTASGPLGAASLELASSLPADDQLALQVQLDGTFELDHQDGLAKLLSISEQGLRLRSLRVWAFDGQTRFTTKEAFTIVESFDEPFARLSAWRSLLGRMSSSARSKESTVQSVLGLIPRLSDVELVNETLDELASAGSDPDAARLREKQIRWNVDLTYPDSRAAGCMAAMGLGMSNAQNARLADAAMQALDAVQDDAVRADLLVRYVASIPGAPIWAETDALRQADRIADERLRARALTALIGLEAIRDGVIKRALDLSDAWARATVLLAFGPWGPPPSGWTRSAWRSCRLDAARAVDRTDVRAHFLILAASEQPAGARESVAGEALAAARATTASAARAKALYQLIKEGLIARSLAGEALESAWAIRPGVARYQALARIALLLRPSEFGTVVEQLITDVAAEASHIDFQRLCQAPGLDLTLDTCYYC